MIFAGGNSNKSATENMHAATGVFRCPGPGQRDWWQADHLAYGVLMLAGAPYRWLADAILAHPTMAEGLGMLFSNLPRRSLQHVAPERAA
jgi:hypothetical protein